MKFLVCCFILVLSFALPKDGQALEMTEKNVITHDEWGAYFKKAAIAGTIVIKKDGDPGLHVYNLQRAQSRRVPASTFKIFNTLIAYETGVVTDDKKLFKWDGKPKWIKAWEQDLNIRQAIAFSAVPVYQQIAREIGAVRMVSFLKQLDYGNHSISGGITRFWLDRGLVISAVEQIEMLEKLYHARLPVSKEGQAFVKDILPAAKRGCFTAHGKTGWAFTNKKPDHGWWVGWAQQTSEAKPIYFALNADVRDKSQLGLRQSLVFDVLHDFVQLREKECQVN